MHTELPILHQVVYAACPRLVRGFFLPQITASVDQALGRFRDNAISTTVLRGIESLIGNIER